MSAEGDGPSTRGGPLSGEEREALARLEAQVRQDDPGLEARLRGGGFFRASWARLPAWRPGDVPLWAAALLAVAGVVLTMLAETTVVWVAVAGVALMGWGSYRLGLGVTHRWRASSRRGGPAGAAGA